MLCQVYPGVRREGPGVEPEAAAVPALAFTRAMPAGPEVGQGTVDSVSPYHTAAPGGSVVVPGGHREGQAQEVGGAPPPLQAMPQPHCLPVGAVAPGVPAEPGGGEAPQGPLQAGEVSPGEDPKVALGQAVGNSHPMPPQ